jgi:hypothetical protein
MEAEAKGMVAEAARMKKEAEKLFPNVSSSKTSSKEVTETVVSGQDVPKVRRGRGPNKPKASKVADGTK